MAVSSSQTCAVTYFTEQLHMKDNNISCFKFELDHNPVLWSLTDCRIMWMWIPLTRCPTFFSAHNDNNTPNSDYCIGLKVLFNTFLCIYGISKWLTEILLYGMHSTEFHIYWQIMWILYLNALSTSSIQYKYFQYWIIKRIFIQKHWIIYDHLYFGQTTYAN